MKNNQIRVMCGGSWYDVYIARSITVQGLDSNIIGWVKRRVEDIASGYSPAFGDFIAYAAGELKETSWITKVDAPIQVQQEGVVY